MKMYWLATRSTLELELRFQSRLHSLYDFILLMGFMSKARGPGYEAASPGPPYNLLVEQKYDTPCDVTLDQCGCVHGDASLVSFQSIQCEHSIASSETDERV